MAMMGWAVSMTGSERTRPLAVISKERELLVEVMAREAFHRQVIGRRDVIANSNTIFENERVDLLAWKQTPSDTR